MTEDLNLAIGRSLIAGAVLLALAGCTAYREHSQGLSLVEQGETAKGLESLRRAASLEPRNPAFQMDYVKKMQQAVQAGLAAGAVLMEVGKLEEASRQYQDVLKLEPHNRQALKGQQRVETLQRAEQQVAAADKALQAGKADQALELVQQVLREVPGHVQADQVRRSAESKLESDRQTREEQLKARAAFRRPVSLTFRDTPLKLIFEAISRAANINVVLDRDVKSDVKTTIFVKDAPIEDAIDVLLLQNQLDKRVLNGNSILVFPATAAKQKEFAELKVRSFQVSNIDSALMANILKTVLKTKDIVTDPKTNILVMRDTAEAIALAERLVAANDVPDAEVMLEVNVLEVSATRANELGLKLPTSASLSTPTKGADGASWTASDLRALTRGQLVVSPLSATLNLMLQDGDTQLLASPQIRTRNKEKARILVGDKLPQITNVLSATGTTAANASGYSALTGSIQYIDVGIKLEVEPEVYTDGDVGIKLMLEVSNVTGTMTTQSGTAYQIGTRTAQTSLRLHDGETQILGGLIRDSENEAAQKLPGIGQLPMLGRLFSNHKVDGQKTEIVVAITPRIIRARSVPDLRNADAWSGTDATLRDRPLRLDSIGGLKVGTPAVSAGQPARPATPAVQPRALPAPAATPAAPAAAPGAAGAAPANAEEPAADAPAAEAEGGAPSSPAPAGVPTVIPRTMPGGNPRPAPTPEPSAN